MGSSDNDTSLQILVRQALFLAIAALRSLEWLEPVRNSSRCTVQPLAAAAPGAIGHVRIFG